MSGLPSHKRGDTYEITVSRRDSAGALVDLTGWTVRAQARDGGGALIEELTVTSGGLGVVTLSATAAQTALWPLATLAIDVQYTEPSGRVSSTPTLRLPIAEDVTR